MIASFQRHKSFHFPVERRSFDLEQSVFLFSAEMGWVPAQGAHTNAAPRRAYPAPFRLYRYFSSSCLIF